MVGSNRSRICHAWMRVFITPSVVLFGWLLATAPPAAADLVVSALPSSQTIRPGGTYEFELLVGYQSIHGDGIGIDDFQVTLNAPGLVFTGISQSGRSHPYLLPSGSFNLIGEISEFPSDSTVFYHDFIFDRLSPFFCCDNIFAGETKSVGRFMFQAAPDVAPGVIPISINRGRTFFDYNDFFVHVSFPYRTAEANNVVGTVTVAAVPEPSSFALVGILAMAGMLERWRRRGTNRTGETR